MKVKNRDLKHVRRLMGFRLGAALALVVGCAMVAGTLGWSTSAHADTPTATPTPTILHGISFLKGCNSPTTVGDPYICTFQALNVVDQAHDTLTITSLVDVVHAGSGDVTSTNLLPTPAVLTLAGGATCNVGQTLCTLPFGSSVTLTASYYNVHPNDPNPLTDTATLTWQDTCSGGTPTPNCPAGQTLHTNAGSESEVQTPTPTPTNTLTPTPTPTNTATPTPTATHPPTGVGGMIELPPAALAAASDTTASDSGWTVWSYGALAAGIVAAAFAVAASGWYTKRRWLR